MTSIIGRVKGRRYPAAMSSMAQPMLSALLAEQRDLEGRIRELQASPSDALAVGEALLAFAAREDEAFSTLAPLLDPAAHAELAAEHQQFAEDLELLEWLLRTTPGSPDVPMLTMSLIRRMRQHIDRDGRLLARAATLHGSQGSPPTPQ